MYNTLIAYYKVKNQIVIPVASSGIAALLLDGGMTAHSKFKIPIVVNELSVCNIKLQSPEAQAIRDAKLIIWDEATMANKYCFEAVDRLLRDIMKTVDPNLNKIPFGGKKFLAGGDFRQTLPIIIKGSRADILYATLKSSFLWSYVQKFKLITNMRLTNNSSENYREFLMKIGNGTLTTQSFNDVPDFIEIPFNMWQPLNKENVFENIFDDFEKCHACPDYLNGRAILCPLNKDTDEINELASGKLPGNYTDYLSVDSIEDDGHNTHAFPPEFLNSIQISGLPPHQLKLKVNQAIILVRNISNRKGLCNGTRLIIKGTD